MRWTLASPSLGVYINSPGNLTRSQETKWRQGRQSVKSAPANFRHRKSLRSTIDEYRPVSVATPRYTTKENNRISVDDVLSFVERSREVSSSENRRLVMEEAQRVVRHESAIPDSSRPQSVLACGLQAMTSPLPLSAKSSNRSPNIDHIPTLLPLPSDRTFIPSPDYESSRHMNTPVDDSMFTERSQSVARQCCEIIGASMCKACRRLESRMLNREKAEKECPRMHISQQNIAMTQIVKRFFPFMSEDEIQDKIARGEIRRRKFLAKNYRCSHHQNDTDSEDDDVDNNILPDEVNGSDNKSEKSNVSRKSTNNKTQVTSHNPLYLLTKLSMKLKGETSTPLFFSNLKAMQTKILSGEVEKKAYMKPKHEVVRLKSAVSSVSTASSGSGLTKAGQRLSATLLPTFVSPRKVTMVEEPKYKAYFEPPLLSKRRQIPNPSFFAGSTDEYSLPERLPDVIEFGDSKRIAMLEKQMRSNSSMSFASSVQSEDVGGDPLERSGSRTARSERQGSARDPTLGDSMNSARSEDGKSSDARPGSTVRSSFRISTEAGLSDHEEEKEHEIEAERKHGEEAKESENAVSMETGVREQETAGNGRVGEESASEHHTVRGKEERDVNKNSAPDVDFSNNEKRDNVSIGPENETNLDTEHAQTSCGSGKNSDNVNNIPAQAAAQGAQNLGDTFDSPNAKEEEESSEEEVEILEHLKVSSAQEEDMTAEVDAGVTRESQSRISQAPSSGRSMDFESGEQDQQENEQLARKYEDVLNANSESVDDATIGDEKEDNEASCVADEEEKEEKRLEGGDGMLGVGLRVVEDDVMSKGQTGSVYSSDIDTESYFDGNIEGEDGEEMM